MEDDQPAPPGTGPDEGPPDWVLGQQAWVRPAMTGEGLCYCKAELGSGSPEIASKEGSGIRTLTFYLQTVIQIHMQAGCCPKGSGLQPTHPLGPGTWTPQLSSI